ncbi:MAG TPA: hypothetical protein VD886_20360, partial [Herpetosiphonaceae bacterium]|nr:hypothetical protein [Herpetosiphonaceae bacterium]
MPVPREPRNGRPGSAMAALTSVGLGVAIFDWLGSWAAYGSLLWEDLRLGCPPSRFLIALVAAPPVIAACGSLALLAAQRGARFRRLYVVTSSLFWLLLPLGVALA